MSLSPERQGDLFPRLSPQTVELHLERAQRRLRRLTPQLSPAAIAELLGEIALLELKVDRLETRMMMMERFGISGAAPTAPLSPVSGPPAWALSAAERLPPAQWRHRAGPPSPTSATSSNSTTAADG